MDESNIKLSQFLAIKPDESVLVLADGLLEKGIPELFVQEAKKITNRVKLVYIKPTGGHGVEPPEKIAKLMREHDVVLMPTYYSLSHTKARKDACKKGARIASMPGITWDTIKRTLTINYKKVAKLSQTIANLLTKANAAQLTNPNGTNLLFRLQNRQAVADTGLLTKPGDFGNLPAGEAFIAPWEYKTTGTLVFDTVYGDKKLTQPLSFTLSTPGVAIPSNTGKMAKLINQELDSIGPKARNIAELGIGTNPAATYQGGLLELEKIYGTCHIALGNNAFFGGTVNVPYHVDGLISQPTLILDNKTIIKNGKFILDKS